MNYKYNPSFVRDVKKTTIEVQVNLSDAIENTKSAKVFNDIANVKN